MIFITLPLQANGDTPSLSDIQISLTNEKGVEVPLKIVDNEDGTFTVDYVVQHPGTYFIKVHYGGVKTPQSPISVTVQPHVDVSKIKVDGLEPTAPVNSLQQFRVITHGAGKADFAVAITSPSGSKVKAHVIPTHEGFLVNFTPTELGEYLLSISFGGEPVSPTPYRFTCMHGSDPTKVHATGPGLERGVVGNPAEFCIDTRGAGQGGLGVTVEGPCEAAINCRDNGDGTCSVAYLPTEIGDYSINITFNDHHIPGSPFQALVVPEADLKKIKVSGNGIQPHVITHHEEFRNSASEQPSPQPSFSYKLRPLISLTIFAAAPAFFETSCLELPVRHIAQGLPHGGTPTGFLEICQYWKLAKTV
uniref:Filamin n=1 Tax=Timema genevievae TaxID=629358 RepID=A0A7R9JMV6_TIMGE|nr:unnamed protein product [Timema genevievae]